jgi:hypothetical protein
MKPREANFHCPSSGIRSHDVLWTLQWCQQLGQYNKGIGPNIDELYRGRGNALMRPLEYCRAFVKVKPPVRTFMRPRGSSWTELELARAQVQPVDVIVD